MAKVITSTESDNITVKDAKFCIKTEEDFTNVKYHNICTGEVYVKQTGVYDYMVGIPLYLGMVFFIVFGLYRLFN